MPSNQDRIEKELSALADAQTQFKREQTRKGYTDELMKDPRRGGYHAQAKGRKLLPVNQREAFKDVVESVVRNTDVPNDQIHEAAREACNQAIAEWREDLTHAEWAIRKVKGDLEKASSPFGDESALTRYLMELQVTGGAPQTKAEILAAVRSAANGTDAGAVQFWAKHGQRLFQNAGGNATVSELNEALSMIDAGINELRTFEQRQAARKLAELNEATADVDQALQMAALVTEVSVMPEIRERTDIEKDTAANKERLAKSKAETAAARDALIESRTTTHAERAQLMRDRVFEG